MKCSAGLTQVKSEVSVLTFLLLLSDEAEFDLMMLSMLRRQPETSNKALSNYYLGTE